MRQWFLAAILAIALAPFAPAAADGKRAGIAAVIERQIAAFRASDLPGAFAFASPTIRQKFGTPERFGDMVRRGYPMIWRPTRWQMLKLVKTPLGPVQVVLFQDESGRLWEAGYLMKSVGGVWRINGVHVRRRPGTGA